MPIEPPNAPKAETVAVEVAPQVLVNPQGSSGSTSTPHISSNARTRTHAHGAQTRISLLPLLPATGRQPVYEVTLTPTGHGPEPHIRLRHALKALLRIYGLRATSARELPAA